MKSIYVRTKDGALIRVNQDNILFAHPDTEDYYHGGDDHGKTVIRGVTVGFANCDGEYMSHFLRTEREADVITAIVDALAELGEDIAEEPSGEGV